MRKTFTIKIDSISQEEAEKQIAELLREYHTDIDWSKYQRALDIKMNRELRTKKLEKINGTN